MDVQTQNGVDRRILHAARVDHMLCAAVLFFTGLEEELHSTAEAVLQLIQYHGAAQQHGGMHIVTAGVHHAGGLAGIGNVVGF